MKPLLSNKIVSNEKTTPVEGGGIINTDQSLNNFFSNIVKNLEISQSAK